MRTKKRNRPTVLFCSRSSRQLPPVLLCVRKTSTRRILLGLRCMCSFVSENVHVHQMRRIDARKFRKMCLRACDIHEHMSYYSSSSICIQKNSIVANATKKRRGRHSWKTRGKRQNSLEMVCTWQSPTLASYTVSFLCAQFFVSQNE